MRQSGDLCAINLVLILFLVLYVLNVLIYDIATIYRGSMVHLYKCL